MKAEVKVADGQSKAGIPVTFNVDPYDANSEKVSSLNKAQVVEVTTDDKGVATYTYTQYNAGADQVVAYATGNASSRDFAKVYWGVKPILTLTTKDGVTVENGKAKTYTATYLDPVTGTPLSNKELNVTFKENIDASVTNDSSAVATDVNTGAVVKPYESATNQTVLKVKTNAKGEATFTVTGSNTEVTPIVYLDSDALNTAGYNRINTRDLQATTETTKFVGGVYTFKFNKEEQFEAVVGKPFTYEVEVTKADGKPYAGGTATVALHELIDSSLSTNTTAYIVNNSKVKAIPGKSGVYTIQLDKDGKAKFDVQADRTEVSATPVVWVDINTASNIEGTLEKEEAFKLAGSVIFRNEVIGGAELENTSDVTGIYGVSGTGLQQPNYEIRLLDQAGSEYSRNDYAVNRVTYTLTNTGNSAVTLALTTTNFTIDTISNNSAATNLVIAAGGSVTVTGHTTTNPKNVALEVSNANAGTVSVTGSVTTSVLRSGTWTNHNSYYTAGNDTTTWVAASPATTEVTGVVKGYQTVDGTADWGYALVLVDGSSTYQIVKYDSSNTYFSGTLTDFNRLNATDVAGFETAISLEDRISLKNSEIRLINLDSSSKATQVKGNTGSIAAPILTQLQKLIADADALVKGAIAGTDPGQWSTAAITAFQGAIVAADATIVPGATNAELQTAYTTLETAITTFKAAQNRTALEQAKFDLKTAINAAEAAGYVAADHTAGSWTAYSTALAAAKAGLTNTALTAAQLGTLQTGLTNAETALVDISDLKVTVTKAEAAVESHYTSLVWADVQAYLATAKTVLGNASATQGAVDAAELNLTTAIDNKIVATITGQGTTTVTLTFTAGTEAYAGTAVIDATSTFAGATVGTQSTTTGAVVIELASAPVTANNGETILVEYTDAANATQTLTLTWNDATAKWVLS